MFDYFKKAKQRKFEQADNVENGKNPKKDIVFIIILIVFGAIIAVSLVTGVINIGSGSEPVDFNFKFSISDGVILGGLVLAYIITRIRKGRR